MELPDITSFDKDAPESFYLGSYEGEFAGLADATLVVGGRKLPVHTLLVAASCRCTRRCRRSTAACCARLSLAHREKSKVGQHCQHGVPCQHLRTGAFLPHLVWVDATSLLTRLQAEKLNLRSCFEGFSIREAAAFLRFVCWPEEATPASFNGLGLSSAWLNGVARLAHFLDAAALLHKLDAFFASEGACYCHRRGRFLTPAKHTQTVPCWRPHGRQTLTHATFQSCDISTLSMPP